MRVFPAQATLSDGTVVAPAMVDEAGGKVRVWAALGDLPKPVTAQPGDRDGVRLVTEVPGRLTRNGKGWIAGGLTVVKTGGCGCGHPLRRFRAPR